MTHPCPSCATLLEVEPGVATACGLCAHEFTPAAPAPPPPTSAPDPGKLARALQSVIHPQFTPPVATHLCVLCHTVGLPLHDRHSDIGSPLLFVFGLLVAIAGALVSGVIIVVGGLVLVAASFINQSINGLNRPRRLCPACGSDQVIPLGTPRAGSIPR